MKSIRTRLITYMLFIAAIPIAAFLLYSLVFVSDEVNETQISAIETKINWSEQYLSSVIDQLEDLVYSIHIENQLLEKVDQLYVDSTDIEQTIRSSLYVNNNLLSSVSVFSMQSLNEIHIDYERGVTKSILTFNDDQITALSEPQGLLFQVKNDKINVLHSINDFDTKALEGGIVLTLNNNLETELLDILGKNSSFSLISNQQLILSNQVELDMNYQPYIDAYKIGDLEVMQSRYESDELFITRIGTTDLFLVYHEDTSLLNAYNNNLINVALFIVISTFVFAILTSIWFSSRITVPITTLVSHMKEFSFSRVETNSAPYDEIHLLEISYNQMIENMNQMIQDKYQNELDRKNAQLKALQAQINPHFLSNTFQLIGGMALSIDAQKIYEATIKMSNLVRYSMNLTDDATTLEDELTHLKDYLDIQKLRFGDKLIFNIDVESKFKKIKIPKFTLQPMIENTFKHGFKHKKGDWKITLTVSKSDDIYLEIMDNGLGLSEDDIVRINQSFKVKDNYLQNKGQHVFSGIALENIDSRIKLLYGNLYGLTIKKNEIEDGTTIVIKLPKEGQKL